MIQIARVFNPVEIIHIVNVTISGSGSDPYAYVVINGETITSAKNAELNAGDNIRFAIGGQGGIVKIDGVTVASTATSMAKQTYDWTIPSGVKNISISLVMVSFSHGEITVTTS